MLTVLTRICLAMANDRFAARLVILAMQALSRRTTNTVDDELVSMIADELGRRTWEK